MSLEMLDLLPRIRALEEELKNLRELIETRPRPDPYDPLPMRSMSYACAVCGAVFESNRAYGYVCQNVNCPSGFGPRVVISATGSLVNGTPHVDNSYTAVATYPGAQ